MQQLSLLGNAPFSKRILQFQKDNLSFSNGCVIFPYQGRRKLHGTYINHETLGRELVVGSCKQERSGPPLPPSDISQEEKYRSLTSKVDNFMKFFHGEQCRKWKLNHFYAIVHSSRKYSKEEVGRFDVIFSLYETVRPSSLSVTCVQVRSHGFLGLGPPPIPSFPSTGGGGGRGRGGGYNQYHGRGGPGGRDSPIKTKMTSVNSRTKNRIRKEKVGFFFSINGKVVSHFWRNSGHVFQNVIVPFLGGEIVATATMGQILSGESSFPRKGDK